MSTFTAKCPLCEGDSEQRLRDINDKTHVTCKSCNEFVISRRAKEVLLEIPLESRAKYSVLSRQSNAEKLLFIIMPLVGTVGPVHTEFRQRPT